MERFIWNGPGSLSCNGRLFSAGDVFTAEQVPTVGKLVTSGKASQYLSHVRKPEQSAPVDKPEPEPTEDLETFRPAKRGRPKKKRG